MSMDSNNPFDDEGDVPPVPDPILGVRLRPGVSEIEARSKLDGGGIPMWTVHFRLSGRTIFLTDEQFKESYCTVDPWTDGDLAAGFEQAEVNSSSVIDNLVQLVRDAAKYADKSAEKILLISPLPDDFEHDRNCIAGGLRSQSVILLKRLNREISGNVPK
jgi:hypothetical protein